MKGRVLIVAGSDSGGGAGIQADIKTVTVLGGFAATAVTALTAQNTLAVLDIFPVPADFVVRQMTAVLDDIGADCIKTGMLMSAQVIDAVADCLNRKARDIPLVLDPVMVATSGGLLLASDAVQTLIERLAVRATLITPNVPEAERLTGLEIKDVNGMNEAARRILAIGPQAVLLKGGHLAGEVVSDILVTAAGAEVFQSPRVNTTQTHGTGCTLASGVAAGLAQGMTLRDAVVRARALVLKALQTAPGIGHGAGPVNHCAWIE